MLNSLLGAAVIDCQRHCMRLSGDFCLDSLLTHFNTRAFVHFLVSFTGRSEQKCRVGIPFGRRGEGEWAGERRGWEVLSSGGAMREEGVATPYPSP